MKSNPEFTKLKETLGIKKDRDPLVNESPKLNSEELIRYYQGYIEEGKERWAQVIDDLNTKNKIVEAQEKKIKFLEEQVQDAANVRIPNENIPVNAKARGFHYFREIINGMTTAGVFDVSRIAAGIKSGPTAVTGDAYVALMFRHAAGLTEIACRETIGRF